MRKADFSPEEYFCLEFNDRIRRDVERFLRSNGVMVLPDEKCTDIGMAWTAELFRVLWKAAFREEQHPLSH
jgi:hypothetical protein